MSAAARIAARAAAASLGATVAAPALAHGFGQRFDLPVPMWLWLVGAGLTVVLSFATVIDFLPKRFERIDHPRVDVLGWPPVRFLNAPALRAALRLLAVALLAATVLSGILGTEDPQRNLAPTMTWIVFWVGAAFVSALLGNVWSAINPLRTIFVWIESAHRRLRGVPLAPLMPYPGWLDRWPAVLLMLAFGWLEHMAEDAATPRLIGLLLLAYVATTVAGMLCFGREAWLRNGELFEIIFDLFARFAPLRMETAGDAADRRPHLWLRPPAVGLIDRNGVSFATVVLIIALLAGVTFDGFLATPLWNAIVEALGDGTPADAHKAVAMLLFPAAFLALFLACCASIARLGELEQPWSGGLRHTASRFVVTLVPIAIAYHLAHYLTLLLNGGQLLIPLVSDPLGRGWDLFGTAAYIPELALLDMRTVWTILVSSIVVGHMLAVYLGHVVALHAMHARASAIRSQAPLLLLMVAYTMASLWILAQPIVE